MKIFVDVDTQVDLCFKYSELAPVGADRVLAKCEDLVNFAVKRNHLIFGSVETHDFDSWVFKNSTEQPWSDRTKPNLPVHCLKGTNGWLKVHETMVRKTLVVPNVILSDNDDLKKLSEKLAHPNLQSVVFEKEHNSMFTNPNTAAVLYSVINKKSVLDIDKAVTPLELGNLGVEFLVFGGGRFVNETAGQLHKWIQTFIKNPTTATITLVRDCILESDQTTKVKTLLELGITQTTSNQIVT